MKLKFGRLWIFVLTGCLLGWAGTAFSGQGSAAATPTTGAEGKVVFVISITKAPNDVKAFGFDLLYPKKIMSYEKTDRGKLAKKVFTMFGANEISSGRLRIGGVATGKNYIKKGASGELAVLTFKASKNTTPIFNITAIKDNMKGWSFSGKTGDPLDVTKAVNIRKDAQIKHNNKIKKRRKL